MKLASTIIAVMIVLTCQSQVTQKSVVNREAESARQETQEIPKAVVTRQESGSNYIYEFVSNRNMTSERAARWESRYMAEYPELVSISIDVQSQEVVIEIPNTHTTSELEEMLSRFGYSGYQLAN